MSVSQVVWTFSRFLKTTSRSDERGDIPVVHSSVRNLTATHQLPQNNAVRPLEEQKDTQSITQYLTLWKLPFDCQKIAKNLTFFQKKNC